jgi:hypothetical protein
VPDRKHALTYAEDIARRARIVDERELGLAGAACQVLPLRRSAIVLFHLRPKVNECKKSRAAASAL